MTDVTVVMAVFNGMPYPKEAVDSIIHQTLRKFLFIIINDGSTDGTKDYLDGLMDPRIVVVHQENHGQGAARNQGLSMCSSEFVAIMGADDIALPERLEKQVNYLRQHESIGMVGTQIAFISSGKRSGFSPPLPCDHQTIYKDLLCGRHAICNPSLLCRTSVLKAIGGYKIGSKGEDWDMFLRMGETTRLANLHDIQHLYRIHSKSENARIIDRVRAQQGHSCLCARLRAEGLPEISFDEFLKQRHEGSLFAKMICVMDVYASSQYRRALAEFLDEKRLRGSMRLAWSALCSPSRTSQYFSRSIRNCLK